MNPSEVIEQKLAALRERVIDPKADEIAMGREQAKADRNHRRATVILAAGVVVFGVMTFLGVGEWPHTGGLVRFFILLALCICVMGTLYHLATRAGDVPTQGRQWEAVNYEVLGRFEPELKQIAAEWMELGAGSQLRAKDFGLLLEVDRQIKAIRMQEAFAMEVGRPAGDNVARTIHIEQQTINVGSR